MQQTESFPSYLGIGIKLIICTSTNINYIKLDQIIIKSFQLIVIMGGTVC